MAGTNYNNLRYADESEKKLSELTSKINEVGKQFGIKIKI